eukprot:jgi/Tetstr1/448318/TSEL_035602.t1
MWTFSRPSSRCCRRCSARHEAAQSPAAGHLRGCGHPDRGSYIGVASLAPTRGLDELWAASGQPRPSQPGNGMLCGGELAAKEAVGEPKPSSMRKLGELSSAGPAAAAGLCSSGPHVGGLRSSDGGADGLAAPLSKGGDFLCR